MPHHRNACSTVVLFAVLTAGATAAEITITGTPAETAVVGEQYEFVPNVVNANIPDLQFAYINRPNWSGAYRRSGAIIGTPTEPGVYPDIQLEAWDGVHFGISAPFTITVAAAGSSPVGSVTLRWVKPSVNTDGSALTNLAGYVIRFGTHPTQLDARLLIDSAESTTAEIENLAPGIWYFDIAAVTDANVYGPFSAIAQDSI